MIVLEKENYFHMIAQHDHAIISRQIVEQWKNHYLLRSKLREEADWAIQQHDRAWIPLDQDPEWNEDKERPYTFVDYPLKKKLSAYQRGIQEVASQSMYAGMLCSMHYASFFSEKDDNPLVQAFLTEEKKRQKDLFASMEMDIPYDVYDLHFRRLQFCDDLSLYVCMQEPGTPKKKEVPWFKEGFRQAFDFAPDGMLANWVDETSVSVDPFPFEYPFSVDIPYRAVSKQEIEEKGLSKAFQETGVSRYTITFIKIE
ncbi:Protein of unknown function [Halobacillus karajensis]|uniref:DUF3891 family protein n=1 Tax=Halobacillus karajensis TaxID=195088 RepID=A0A059NXP8_9BACI|nr:DUF3891 family protein [Halobacillus karajensis]CDQ18363.1 hypothetical protein BN982_00630 [Halobacillus karajensis]CDQ23565.1 hypothetical protein BN983_01798 [Halobacillus karajensis]CDQ27047.1 hypothetical protein BN981_01278 [Halobacillus karajensis]SEH52526.1 Protein of unknown function [Halobacillus karajensis]